LASIAVSFALIVGVSHTTSRQYKKLAHHDSLTHVLNRRGFTVEATQLAENNPDNFSALIFIDLNRFKHINDQFGHAHGDRVLRKFSTLAQSVIPTNSVFGRLSGDEFAVYIKGCSISQAHRLMDQLSAEVAKAFDFYKLDFSWGLAFTQSRDVNIESLMREADAAMYRRKLQSSTVSKSTASRPMEG
jgi:diguanylate cyclase (GGDEF)-like protein